jgi:hypothetical protein
MQWNVERDSLAWLAGEYKWLTELILFFERGNRIDI